MATPAENQGVAQLQQTVEAPDVGSISLRESTNSTCRTCRICGHKGRFYRDEPSGYVEWFEWAERMSRTHAQHPCPGCSRLTVWGKK